MYVRARARETPFAREENSLVKGDEREEVQGCERANDRAPRWLGIFLVSFLLLCVCVCVCVCVCMCVCS